jgi:hypothetical protein
MTLTEAIKQYLNTLPEDELLTRKELGERIGRNLESGGPQGRLIRLTDNRELIQKDGSPVWVYGSVFAIRKLRTALQKEAT